jgi:phosphoserine phosphatase
MVSRCGSNDFVVIFDLDGTILSVNSFPRWVMFLMRARLPHLGRLHRWRVAGVVATSILRRKLRLIGHEKLKWALQNVWQTATRGDNGNSEECFVEELMGFVRPELAPVLSAVSASEVDAIMATAAPGDYAYGLGRRLGFRDVLATPPMRAAAGIGNIGERKRDAVMSMITERGWQDRPRICFTDHREDLPLIRVCQRAFWFGSEPERQAIARVLPNTVIENGLNPATCRI